MKCNDARTFMSQIAGKSVTIQVQQSDVNFLSANGYLYVMQKGDYDQAVAEVANLTQMNNALQNERVQEGIARAALILQRVVHLCQVCNFSHSLIIVSLLHYG